MEKLLVTHIDLDGVGCAVLATLYQDMLGVTKIDMRDYGFEKDTELMQWYKSFPSVMFADLSMPESDAEAFSKSVPDVRYFDHHLSAEWLSHKEGSVYSTEKCGTRLMWEGLIKPNLKRYPPSVERFVHLVDTYDCWHEDSPDWHEAVSLNFLMYAKPYRNYDVDKTPYLQTEVFISHLVDKLTKDKTTFKFDENERKEIDASWDRLKWVHDKALDNLDIREDSKGKVFGLTSASSKISLVCSMLLHENPAMDYLICVNTFRGVNGKLSFRTKREGFDLNTIGIANGHEQACGGMLTPENAVAFMKNHKLTFRYKDDPVFDVDNPDTWTVEVAQK